MIRRETEAFDGGKPKLPKFRRMRLGGELAEARKMANLLRGGYILFLKLNINFTVEGNQGRSALHLASLGGDERMVDHLLKDPKVDVNLKDDIGMTALVFASLAGHARIVKLLLRTRRIDVTLKDALGGATALH